MFDNIRHDLDGTKQYFGHKWLYFDNFDNSKHDFIVLL